MKSRSSSLVLLALTVVATACGGGSSGEESTTTVRVTTAPTTAAPTTSTAATTEAPTTTAAPVPRMPLTGLPVVDEAIAERPAIMAKIDNAPGARPQTGLVMADIVYEENVEQWTRFAAVFHSQGSDPVGPIRSGRTQDINLGTSLDRPLFVWSGGNPTVSNLINQSELVNMSVSKAGPDGGYFRSTDKKAPHNLFTSTTNIWLLDADRGGTPPPQFSYLEEGLPTEGLEAAGAKLKMDGSMKASWEWDAESELYLRTHDKSPHVEADGTRVSTNNVVILTCDYKASVADSRSPEAQTVGTGAAVVLSGGRVIEGTWSRADSRSAWVLQTTDGQEIRLAPGRTWVELIREGQAVVVPAGGSVADTPYP